MGFGNIYICHCYDIIEHLSESRNDTRLVIDHSSSVSEDKHGNLGVIGSGCSYRFFR